MNQKIVRKDIKQVVAFGCSLTYGYALNDVWDIDNDCHKPTTRTPPSKFGWPQLIADKLKVDCKNYGYPGRSNSAIRNDIITKKFLPGDIAIVQWTFNDRFSMYVNETQYISYNIHDVKTVKSARAYFENIHSKNLATLETNLAMSHASLYLKSLNIPQYHVLVDSDMKILPFNNANVIKPNNGILQLNYP